MTKEEFTAAFRGRMLLFLTEAWAARKESPSNLGLLIDCHREQAGRLMSEMWEALCPKGPQEPVKPANGQPGVKR